MRNREQKAASGSVDKTNREGHCPGTGVKNRPSRPAVGFPRKDCHLRMQESETRMNTQFPIDDSGTDMPPADLCERHVADARRLFQCTLAKWASDVLLMREQRLTVPAWDKSPCGSMSLIRPGDELDGWNQAA